MPVGEDRATRQRIIPIAERVLHRAGFVNVVAEDVSAAAQSRRARVARLAGVLLFALPLLAASCAPAEPESSPDSAPGDPAGSAARTPATAPGPFSPAAVTRQPVGIDTSELVLVPDPLSSDNPRYPEEDPGVPAVGATLADTGLGTTVARVTEQPGVRHEYSRFDPFNADKSMIVLLDDGFKVFRTRVPYDRPDNLVRILDLEEPRWDRADANLIIGLSGFQIVGLDLVTGSQTIIKDFAGDPTIGPLIAAQSDLYRITTRDEGEASLDGNWWALALQGTNDDYRLRYLFCWDRGADEVAGLYELEKGQADIDWLGMSPLGTWVLIGAETDNQSPLSGFTIANRELTEFHKIDETTGHADVGLDVDGEEVLVMQNPQTDYIDLLPLKPSTKPVSEAGGGYEGSGHLPLVRLNYVGDSPVSFDSGVHISCNAPGYALVSTHQAPDASERNWLDRSIILVRLDQSDPRVYLVAKIHNVTQEYWEETHASISTDGHTMVWAANFGIDPGGQKTYLLRLDLP